MALGEARTHSAASAIFSASFTRISPDISFGKEEIAGGGKSSCFRQFARSSAQERADMIHQNDIAYSLIGSESIESA